MSLTSLLDVLTTDAPVRAALAAADSGERVVDVAVAAGARPPLLAALAGAGGGSAHPVLAVTATGREAEDLASALRRLAHPDPADPAYGVVDVVVAPVRALLQPLVTGLAELAPVALTAGQEAPLEEVVEALAAAAYTRTDLVERRGEFAVRGGILDVFPPTEEHPVRVEFWGDTV